jgi:hypothetical protein
LIVLCWNFSDMGAAREKAEAVVAKLEMMKLRAATEKVREGVEETLTYYGSQTSTTAMSARTIRWSGSCVRSAGGAVWWAASRTARVL